MITVPFRLLGSPETLIVFDALLQGHPVQLALDTGAGVTLLHPRVADELAMGSEVLGYGAGGGTPIRFGTASTLALGEAVLCEVPIGVSESVQVIADKIGVPVDGVLGYPELANHTLDINFAEGHFQLTDERIGDEGLAMDTSRALAIIETDGRFAVDTGASRSLFCTDYVLRKGLEVVQGPDIFGSGGAIATFEAGPLVFPFFDRELHVANALCSDFLADLSETIETKLDGILGLEVLAQFRVWFDYPGGRFKAAPPV